MFREADPLLWDDFLELPPSFSKGGAVSASKASAAAAAAAAAERLFAQIDLDGSGEIDYEEFREMANGGDESDELERLFELLDLDGGGSIDATEMEGQLRDVPEAAALAKGFPALHLFLAAARARASAAAGKAYGENNDDGEGAGGGAGASGTTVVVGFDAVGWGWLRNLSAAVTERYVEALRVRAVHVYELLIPPAKDGGASVCGVRFADDRQ